jgi:salicylate hydroxylase
MENSGDSLKIWDMYDMKTLPKWCEGSSAIIGDAAHPFQPCETLSIRDVWNMHS